MLMASLTESSIHSIWPYDVKDTDTNVLYFQKEE